MTNRVKILVDEDTLKTMHIPPLILTSAVPVGNLWLLPAREFIDAAGNLVAYQVPDRAGYTWWIPAGKVEGVQG